MTKKATTYHNLPSGVVIDQSVFNTLKPADAAATITEINATGKTFIFVENAAKFFSKNNIRTTLAGDTTHLPLLLEKAEVVITKEQMEAIKQFSCVRSAIEEALNAVSVHYPFAEVPEGFSVEARFSFSPTRISRNGYHATKVGAKRVWDKASKVWLSRVGENQTSARLSRMNNISMSGYTRDVVIYEDRVEIGCQNIARYELEQLAVFMGWPMPEDA